MTDPREGPAVRPSERRAACLAMVSWWFCDLLGQVLVLWWASRNDSSHARQYAVLSLLLDVPVLVAGLVSMVFLALASGALGVAPLLLSFVLQLVLGVISIQLAVRGWRGEAPRHALVPDAFVRRVARWSGVS